MYQMMLTTLRLLLTLVTAVLVSPLHAQEGGVCRSVCETEKTQCRAGTVSGTTAAGLAAAGVVALGVDQGRVIERIIETPSVLDKQRDMRDVLDARQRAASESKSVRRALDDRCNSTYMRCIGSCIPEPTAPK
ncbi:hypothetical protein [Rhodoferax sp.]|jgi:hypothetical protein|uniref:hypothetical protein n=1 Tax=Rhodoferax sp. TaxID=50421 RepID=UPI003783E7B9